MSLDYTGRVIGGGMYARRKDDVVEPPRPSPCRVTRGYFPDPATALGLGWPAERIMAECRRCPREDLTPELAGRLREHGLRDSQITELYKHSRAYIDALMGNPRAKRKENSEMGDPITFAKALVIGLPAKEALENSMPSTTKEVTKELLQLCADGGLDAKETSLGFGTSRSTIYLLAKKYRINFPRKPRGEVDYIDKGAGDNTGAGEGAKNEGAGEQQTGAGGHKAIDAALAAILQRETDQAKALSAFNPGERPQPSWAHRFGLVTPKEGPELAVTKHGKLTIRRVDMDTDLRYVFDFDEKFTLCRVEALPQGMKLTRSKEGAAFSCSMRKLMRELELAGLAFPVRYRLDPATLIGELVV